MASTRREGVVSLPFVPLAIGGCAGGCSIPAISESDLAKNQILAALPEEESKRLLPHLRSVSLSLGQLLYQPEDLIRHLYFPLDAVISSLASMEDGKSVEINLTGDEGLLGLRAVLGAKVSGYVAVVQVPGRALKIEADLLGAEFRRGGVLQDRVLRYTRYLLFQVSQTAACNRVHRLEQRLARWLLMVHNRAKRDEFPITHEFLSHMLGTPRSEVTIAAGILRKAWLIRYWRGRMTILDRQGLESASCECYRVVSNELKHPG